MYPKAESSEQGRTAGVEPFVSVITVSLNAAATIEDTIASVLMQRTDFGVEHICVDGGSSDATRAIIDRWAARSGRMVRVYEPDSGIFDAMNKGLRAAKGEYVLFLNADDFFVAPDTLAKALAHLSQGAPGNPDLIVGDVSMGELGLTGVWRRRRVPRLLGRLRECGLYPLHQAQLTKRHLLNAIGGFDSRLRYASDVLQYYELERRFRPSVRFIGADVAFMRAGGAANLSWKARYRATAEVYEHLVLIYPPFRAAIMVVIKTLQSALGVRWGRCPHERWFASAQEGALTDK